MKNKGGYFLIEALLGIVIFSMLILSVFSMIGFLQRRVVRSDFESDAARLIQDGMEIAHSAILADWDGYKDGSYYPVFDATNQTWVLLKGEDSDLETRYNRKIVLSKVCRNPLTGEREETGICKGEVDAMTREVEVSVWWEERGENKEVKLKLLVLNTNV